MSRLFLTTMTSSGNEDNLRAMIEPIAPLFDGVIATFHLPSDAGSTYLESRVGAGRVIYAHFSQRHGYSMQHILWQGPMRDGDKFIYLDSMERVSRGFCEGRLKGLIQLMDETDVAMIANFGKGFLFRFNEQLRFEGSPHWCATQLDGRAINMELPKDEFWNVRDQQRSSDQWVSHYAKYWIYPAGSNHALLGLEKQGDPAKLFGPRDARRLAFRREMVKRGYPLTLDGLKEMLSAPLDETLKEHLRAEKTLSDYWHWLHGRGAQLKDTHLPSDALPIP
jgi:hypothetical protein